MARIDENSQFGTLIIEPGDDKIDASAAQSAPPAQAPPFAAGSGLLIIDGDVNSVTGDISYPGIINVSGNIRDGRTVSAGAGLKVGGVVEAAKIQVNGDIVLENGVRGANKAVISATGCIRANFLENCAVNAKGSVYADSILHSQVACGGSLTLSGKYGVLVGGKAVVKRGITANSIGSAVSTPTELYVGFEPEDILLYRQLLDEYTDIMKRYEKVAKSINTLQARESLREERKKTLLNLLRSKMMLKDRLNDLRKAFDSILPGMESHSGFIKAGVMMCYGVKATIGNAVIYIRDDLANCVLTNVNGKINIGINDKGGE